MEDEAIDGLGSQRSLSNTQLKRNSSKSQSVTDSMAPSKHSSMVLLGRTEHQRISLPRAVQQPSVVGNSAPSTQFNGSSVKRSHQPGQLGPPTSDPKLKKQFPIDPSKINVMGPPISSAGKLHSGVNNPSMLPPPAIPVPTQNADSSLSTPTPPAIPAVPVPSQESDSSLPSPPAIPVPSQEIELSLPPPPAIPAPSQNADSSFSTPTPPAIPVPSQEIELSLPMPSSSQPNDSTTISMIQPPTQGIKKDLSGSTTYTVNGSPTFQVLPGPISMNLKPGNPFIFKSDSAVPSSTMSLDKQFSLNERNIHSQPSNAPDGSTLPPPPPPPPVEAEIGQVESQESSNLPPEDFTLKDRYQLSESIVPTAPILLPSHSNENTFELGTQNNANGSNEEVISEDSSDAENTPVDENIDAQASCGHGCTCY